MPEDIYPMAAAGILANPTTTPVLSSSAGALTSGAYLVAYAYVNTNGKTKIGPMSLIAIDDDEQIDVSAVTPLPTGALSVDWFVSEEPNSSTLRFIANNSGGAFSINALPAEDGTLPPSRNTTGGTGVRPTKYIKHPLNLEEITISSVFEDKGAHFRRTAPTAPQRWTLIYVDKNEEKKKVLRDFWHAHGLDIPFTLQEPRDFPWVTGEPGETVTGVLFESYEEPEPTNVRRNHVTVKLIKRL